MPEQSNQRKISRLAFTAIVGILLILPGGCGESEEESKRLGRRTLTMSEIPEDVMKAAKTALPDVEFADGWKNVDKDGKLHSYEIRGRTTNGKIREVRVSPTGDILEME